MLSILKFLYQNFRSLALVVLLSLSSAFAAGDSGGGTGCATLTNPAGSQAGGSSVNLETFVPDPVCWLKDTQKTLKPLTVYSWSRNIAIGMIVVAAGLAALGASLNPAQAMQKIVIAALCFGMLNGYGSSGGAWYLKTMIDNGWNAAYTASATQGQAMLDANTLQGAKDLGTKFETYFTSMARIRYLEHSMKAVGLRDAVTGQNDNLAENYQNTVVKQDVKGDTSYSTPLWSGLAGIAYFMILGMFTVFGVMVYSSGFVVLIIGAALPLIIGACAFGNFTPLLSVSKIGLAAILSIILLPISVGIMTKTMLTSPIQTMNASLDFAIKESTDRINAFQAKVDKCQALSLTACTDAFGDFGRGVAGDTLVLGAGSALGNSLIRDSLLGLGLGAFGVLAAFAGAVTQVRRIPALVFQVLGAAGGGGESSGAFTPPSVSGMASGAGNTAMRAVSLATGPGGKAAGAAATATKAIPQSGPTARTITVTQEAKSSRSLPSSAPKALPAPRSGGRK